MMNTSTKDESLMIDLEMPDGSFRQAKVGTTALAIAESIGSGLKRAAVAAKLNERLIDLRMPLKEGGKFQIVTLKDDAAGEVIRHSAEHIMADAVKRLWPDVQIDVGRTDHSEKFQYDFKINRTFTPEDLKRVEQLANDILKEKALFERSILSRDEAISFFKKQGEALKVKRIADIPEDQEITIYKHAQFTDLCRGPHVQTSDQIGVIKILESSASYWKGDEKEDVLQRIYGTAFRNKKELEDYLHRIEEARRRDHRKIGKELDLFSVSDEVGPGLILWHPKGALIRHLIEDHWKKEHLRAGYDLVYSPHLAKQSMWKTSGHTGFYKDNMFSPMDVEEQPYLIKPMNCPFHIQIYQSHLRSYRDLPIKLAELGTVYRYERSGVLHGLLRVRGFTQDDAHLFVTPDQLNHEIEEVLTFVTSMFATYGFTEYAIFLSTRPKDSVGSDEEWEVATNALKQALERKSLDYQIDPGEGVFYGPKIDIKIKDALGRFWQCATIQADFNLPERFHLEFVDQDGTKRRPIMIHRALLGSIERFFGCLVEHYVGAFPIWLSPVQSVVLPITTKHRAYAAQIFEKIRASGVRVEFDDRNEKLGFKIREAQLKKIPFMIVIGDEEVSTETLTVRHRSGEQWDSISFDTFLEKFWEEEKKTR
ncbi:MAG: threonine--tRNA ligase [Bdellovibrionales bacterium]|nr:threonine--tRNA ligase [Bdellovibrionales bacterium]